MQGVAILEKLQYCLCFEEGDRNINDIQPLTESPFQFSYADEKDNLMKRFNEWLEEAIITGLEYWNRSL